MRTGLLRCAARAKLPEKLAIRKCFFIDGERVSSIFNNLTTSD
jgi:hypothetical protein